MVSVVIGILFFDSKTDYLRLISARLDSFPETSFLEFLHGLPFPENSKHHEIFADVARRLIIQL